MTATAPPRDRMWRELLPPGRRYVTLPSRRHPVVVAEDRAPVLSYVRESLLAVPPSLPGWVYPAARAALAVPGARRCVPRLRVPGPGQEPTPTGTAQSDMGRLLAAGPLVLLDHSHDPDARLVLLLFPPDAELPALAVKVPTGAGGVPGLIREAEQLRAMATLPLGETRPTVPAAVSLLHHLGRPALATTAMPGVPMLVAYHRPGHTARPAPVRADFTAAADWLAALQSATAGERAPLDLASGAAAVLDLRLDGERAKARLHALRRRLRRHTAPLTAVHGDFWPGNILLRGGRVSGVVDWEHARTAGNPLTDPARFVVAYCEYLDRRTRPGHPVPGHPGLVAGQPGAALAYALDGTGWYPRLVRGFLAAALRRLGLPPACGRDAVLAELAAVAAEATDPQFAHAQVQAFVRLTREEA
ncbi:phosphotransferase family protein [Streptomyces gilvus]|uniref:phosphotransferase family protein n=1 Tax=Streptomyces gilvus TaxID=2920937 RepID=UPI001F0D768A|nr:aminoglycoside phosphotransferase family protein [Streptomyces sp. CME 23]MCH5670802.1 aminoglycoside phosphotransferase family protein [Streptomyces sp. CME 23]